MSAGPGGHALLHQVVQNQPDGQVCSAYQRQAHVSSSTHSSPLFHFKDGRTLTSKSFRSTFLPLVWWSYVATIQPNITSTLVQPCTVAARTGLPTDTIWNLGRGEAKHTRHIRIGAATVHVNSYSNSTNCACFNCTLHVSMFTQTTHCVQRQGLGLMP